MKTKPERLWWLGAFLLFAACVPSSVRAGTVLSESFNNDSAFTKFENNDLSNPSRFQGQSWWSWAEDTYWGILDPVGSTDDFDGGSVPSSSRLPGYTGFSGNYMVAENLRDVDSIPLGLRWSGLNVSGMTGLNFSGRFAASSGNDRWETGGFMKVLYRFNGTGSFQNLLWFTPTTSDNSLARDSNFNGTGEGTALSLAAQTFSAAITGTGTTLDLVLLLSSNTRCRDQEFAVDSLTITGVSPLTSPVPEPTLFAMAASGLIPFVACRLRRSRRR